MFRKKDKTNKKAAIKKDVSPETFLSKINPITLFPNNLVAARFWCYAFFVMLFVALIEPIPYFVMVNNRERVVIMDQAGQFIVAPMTDFYHATPIQEYIAREAAKAILNRNPNGIDEPELVRQLYLKPAYKLIMTRSRKLEAKFQEREIHQKCEIMNDDILQKAEGYVMARVKGQFIRVGVYEGQTYSDAFKFILDLKLVRNPKLGNNQRLPYAVSWFDLKTQRVKGNV